MLRVVGSRLERRLQVVLSRGRGLVLGGGLVLVVELAHVDARDEQGDDNRNGRHEPLLQGLSSGAHTSPFALFTPFFGVFNELSDTF